MKNVILTDGGMGQELVRRSKSEPTPLWSARVLIDEPDLVRDLHAEFIRAGARVITINTYSATPERLAREVGASMALCETKKLSSAAFFNDSAGFVAKRNSKGLAAYQRLTGLDFSITVRTPLASG